MERRLYDRISMLTLLIETGRLEADEKDKKAVRRALRNKEARLLWFRHIGVNDRHAPLRQLVQGIEKYEGWYSAVTPCSTTLLMS